MVNIAIVGAGAMGTAMSYLFAENGNEVLLWSRRKEVCNKINNSRTNPDYLQGLILPKNICATDDLKNCLTDAEVIVLAVPSNATQILCKGLCSYVSPKTKWLSVEKGITLPNFLTTADILHHSLQISYENIAALSGPTFASEIVKNVPTISMIGSPSFDFASSLCSLLESQFFIAQPTTDLRGVEISGALKNIGAIAIGIVDGLDLGDNTRGLLFSYYLKEVLRLATKIFGARTETLLSYACLGDMITTSFSNKSRNRILGLLVSKHVTNISSSSFISEGKNTAEALIAFASKNNINLPSIEFVYSVLSGANPLEAFNVLFDTIRKEIDLA